MFEKLMATAMVVWKDRKYYKQRLEEYTLLMSVVFLIAIVGARVATKDMVPQETVKAEVTEVANVLFDCGVSAEPAVDAEAVEMAKVIYGQCRWNSEDAQRAVCWLIINRVESSMYPNDITLVCRQEQQWMGYSTENPVVEEYYQLALQCLRSWRSGGMRPMSGDFLFMTWSQQEIELRTSWNVNANTRYWRVS